MKNISNKFKLRYFGWIVLAVASLMVSSCVEDDYIYDNESPDWLGASIYDYLVEDGNFQNYVRLIEDLDQEFGYKEVLSKTGSKTVFPARDDAFERFFQNNTWGVTRYEDLSISQKKLLVNYSIINNAYLIETLSNYNGFDGLVEGAALRRQTSTSVLDSVPYESGSQIPDNQWFARFKDKGIHMVKDETDWPMVHLLQDMLNYNSITDNDFQIIMGIEREFNDAFIFDSKIIERDVVCKNGYVHILEEVLVPRVNMAQYVKNNANTTVFSRLLHRYCAPYYSSQLTTNYREINPSFTDSIFVKEFFTGAQGGGRAIYPNNRAINSDNLLAFDPGWNSYSNGPLQADMAAMFVPTDETMNAYFDNGQGRILKERYGSWDGVPDDIIALLLRRHMRTSFVESVPSRFDKLTDANNYSIPIEEGHIVDTYIGVNGLVYLTNDIYPPNDYVSVYAPALFNENAKIMNWAIRNNQIGDFRLYLNSLISEYSFFIPSDQYMDEYIDPVTIKKDITGVLKFWYDEEDFDVKATVYTYDLETGEVGDSVGLIENSGFISNRLIDILDNHIVVGDVTSGQRFYLSKGGQLVEATGSGENLVVRGGGDINMGTQCNVIQHYDQENGNTYIIDKPIQTPFNSVYKIMSENEEFNEFFKLLTGFPASAQNAIFLSRNNYYGIDFSVKFFNTFNYTVYIPTNQAVQQAIQNGLIIPWESQDGIIGINDMTNQTEVNEAMNKLERFLRYHFQDNAVYISGSPVNKIHQSATIKLNGGESYFNTFTNKYYKIGINGDGNNLTLTTETGNQVSVITDNNLYNIHARDFIFNADPLDLAEVDGTGTGTAYSGSRIFTSSSAVIHQIDNVLTFE